MPLAVTHVLLAIILVDIYRDHLTKHKKLFTLHTLFIAGVAGLLPDIDFLLRIIAKLLNFQVPELLQHGGITHTPFFGLIFLIPAFYLWKKEKHKKAIYFFVITFGILLHVTLDFVLGGGAAEGIMMFWPVLENSYKIHLLNMYGLKDIPMALDAIILLGWLYHEEMKHRIKDYI